MTYLKAILIFHIDKVNYEKYDAMAKEAEMYMEIRQSSISQFDAPILQN